MKSFVTLVVGALAVGKLVVGLPSSDMWLVKFSSVQYSQYSTMLAISPHHLLLVHISRHYDRLHLSRSSES
jgi:hypothetical protein